MKWFCHNTLSVLCSVLRTFVVTFYLTDYILAIFAQDDADKQWLEDVEARNQQQILTLKVHM